MLNTKQLRAAWAPACAVPLRTVELVQGVKVSVHEKTVPAVKALGRVLEAHGYPVRAADTGAYNCRPITNGTGHSLHAHGIAIDVNWNTNPFRKDNVLVTDMPKAMIANILKIRTVGDLQVWGWGGNYKTVKDAMHFEVVCKPADLERGIDWSTVRQPRLRPDAPHKWPLIQRGDRGPAVQKLHDIMSLVAKGEAGYGTFGPRTEAAVREYQTTHGLEVDGRVGRQTWTALLSGQPEVRPQDPGPVKRQVTAPSPSPAARSTPIGTIVLEV